MPPTTEGMGATPMAVTKVSDFVIERFHPVLSDVTAHGHTHYWLHGGRGSTKSSFISVCLIMLVIAFPQTNAVVVRRFGNTLRDSVLQQCLWAIEVLGLESVFRSKVSPMEIAYTPTGQRIVFRGADDPLKLKGVKFTKGYCAAVWFEEVDQFEGLDAVRSILNSLRRGGDRFWIFYSYNPPKTMWSWVNVELLERKRRNDTLVRDSSYLDVIDSHPEWLGAPFIEEAEYLRDTNETAWRWEYLGEIVGTGGAVFDNVHDVRLSDSRIRGFERVRNGIDGGWFPDPWRFVRCAWEPGVRRLLVFEEHSANKMVPADTGRIMVDSLTYPDEDGGEAYYHDQIVYCDDTPDSKV